IGMSSGVSLIAAIIVWASSRIDVPGNGKAKKAALLLTMNHRDNARPVQFFNCADRLGASNDIPSCREWGLQQRDCDKDPKE
ncbi:MAG: hypothetical protein WA712_14260, partial [Pseudolabrys sp.]